MREPVTLGYKYSPGNANPTRWRACLMAADAVVLYPLPLSAAVKLGAAALEDVVEVAEGALRLGQLLGFRGGGDGG